MARYGRKTNLSPSEVIEKAVKYFGGEWGLSITERTEERVCFASDVGHVTIDTCQNDKTDVELETREFDNPVKEFMSKL